MALFTVPHIEVKGVSACVPLIVDRNRDSRLLSDDEKEKLISSIGVKKKRVADVATCISDLCCIAAAATGEFGLAEITAMKSQKK